jgi:hypothetical protein
MTIINLFPNKEKEFTNNELEVLNCIAEQEIDAFCTFTNEFYQSFSNSALFRDNVHLINKFRDETLENVYKNNYDKDRKYLTQKSASKVYDFYCDTIDIKKISSEIEDFEF